MRSLHGELVDLLHDMLLRGELRPGQKVNEQECCASVSEFHGLPLREALKVLASEGLVILAPNKGARVAKITRQEVDELFPILGCARKLLAGELACTRITKAEVSEIRNMHETMLRHYERGEATEYIKLNRSIHEAIFVAARNGELFQFYQTILVRTHSVRFIAQKSPERWKEAVEDHIHMMAALTARDAKLLGADRNIICDTRLEWFTNLSSEIPDDTLCIE